MYHSTAVFLLAVSCVSSFPVLFLTYEDGDGSQSPPRLLDCVSPIPFLNAAKHGLSYRCRQSTNTLESLGLKADELPVLEIREEPHNEISAIEVNEEIILPGHSFGRETLFQSDKIVVKTQDSSTDDKDKYEVTELKTRSGNKNQGGCDDDEVFVAELDICMPYEPHQVEPQVAHVDSYKPSVPVVSPDHSITKVGYAPIKCKEGQIFQPSIGICVDYDNCLPYPDCSHIEKEKNKVKNKDKKEKNKDNKRTVTEEDDEVTEENDD